MLYLFGDCTVDTARCEVRRAGETVTVEPKVFKVLAYLLEHRDRVVTKDELMERFWPGTFLSESALTHCLTKARKAINDDSVSQGIIKTVRGYGYRFVAAVTVRTSAPPAPPVSASLAAPMPSVPPSTPLAPDTPGVRRVVPGERKQVTVLVAGVHGVAALAQAVDAEALYELLTQASTLMRDAVQGVEGYVTRCTGDALIALFGVPLAHEDHAIRALQAALGLQRAFAAYADEVQRTRAITLHLGVGVHTGIMIIGTHGTEAHPDATAPGFPVYLAERLQALAAPGAIYVSEPVWQQAVGFFRFEDRGACPMPEIVQPVRVYACTGVAQVASRLEAVLHRHRSPFLGREREMDLLSTLWSRVRRGQGQVAVLFGEAGVGKSRLAYEFQGTLADGRLLQAQALSYGQSMAYHAMIPLLRTLVGLTDHETPQDQRQHLRASLAVVQPSLTADEPLLAHLLGVPLEPDALPVLPPEAQKRRLQHACLQVILHAAAAQPLCLLIEDLHWLDPSSRELLDLLVTALAGRPVLLLGTARPGFRETWADHTYFHRLTVTPLSEAHTETFIHNYFSPYAAAAALIARIRDWTAGNPLFVEELLRTMQEQRLIELQDDTYVVKSGVPLAIPSSIHGLLAARIDRLPEEEKRLLQTAAVIGRDVPVPLLQAITELPEEALQRGLTHLQAAEFLYETPPFPASAYTFKHALTHEVAYGSLLRERRRALHACLVGAFEALAPGRAAEQVERLAHHAVRGEVWDKALLYSRHAGDKALLRSAYREAVAGFDQALRALDHLPACRYTLAQAIDLRLNLRDALQGLGELRRITEVLREAETLAETLGDAVRLGQVALFMAGYFHQIGEYARAIATSQRGLALATASGDVALQVGAYYYLSLVYTSQGRYAQAIDCCRWTITALEGERRYERFGHQILPAVLARYSLAWSLAEVGRFAEAVAVGAEGLRIAEAVAHPTTLVYANFGVGIPYLCQGAYDKALPPLERAVGLCHDAGIQFHFASAAYRLGTAYALSGRVAEALALLEQAMQRDAAMGRVGMQARTVAALAEATLLAGHLEKASDLARQALELARAHQERGYQAYILRLLGEIAARQDPLESELAEAHYRQALALAEELGMRPLVAHCHHGLGRLYSQTGRGEEARAELAAAIALYRAMDMTFWLPQAEAALSQRV
jgi:class 3 adenylate cyclase/DNA-binding winged helix-turn-helix (wHTH) protein/tetratricopeptide (TPR) repeat protein